MQKTIITYGLISGLIIVILTIATSSFWMENEKMDMSSGMVVGYINMLLSLSLVFFGTRQYRDRQLDGKISFGKAFKVGFLIALIASAMYVIGWMIYYHTSGLAQTFPEQYMTFTKEKWATSGMSAEEIKEKSVSMEKNFELYNNNPLVLAGFTLMEIFPVALIVSLISAFILRRR